MILDLQIQYLEHKDYINRMKNICFQLKTTLLDLVQDLLMFKVILIYICYQIFPKDMQQGLQQQISQLIDQHKNFDSKALNQILTPMNNCHKDYFTVAIIGSQNTGKSTLLNELFHTNFQVLKGLAGTKTTRGIVLGRDYATNLVVMDVQGNDSYENHAGGDDNYQKMVSSFALVSANLLIVNIPQKQLGQHTGSQYETLSLILRICIDQFKQQSPKTILFVLRDANPQYTDEGECRRKLQIDIQKLWKNVWMGTKREEQFKKYESASERFFTLEVAFLREYDADYPEDFKEDVAKLRERFVNPESEGYLFKKQKKEYNVPAEDLALLLGNIWNRLISDKELNLPNEKVQLANYRCQEIVTEVEKAAEVDLQKHKQEVRNYGEFLNNLSNTFRKKTEQYPKSITEKYQTDLVEKFKVKINNIVVHLLEKKEKDLEEEFAQQIKENIFYEETHTFKEQAKQLQKGFVDKYLSFLREINLQINNRKERIQNLSKKFDEQTNAEVKEKVVWLKTEFETDGQRKMQVLAAQAMKEHLGLQFWSNTYIAYRSVADALLKELNNRFKWARGESATANELDQNEEKLHNWIISHLKKEFENNLSDRLVAYFKTYFFANQHNVPYNFNVMQEHKISEIYAQAKQMTGVLLEELNNFRFQVVKRSSFINTQDFETIDDKKPFLEANSILTIRESFEHKANQEFYTVIRRRKEAQSKKVPWYFFLIIIYFVYDDLPSASENSFLFKLIAFILVFSAIPFAFGQGEVVSQVFNNAATKLGNAASGLKSKFDKSKTQ